MTPEAHKYAAAPRSFCFVTAENGEEQDIYNLTAIPGVQRSLCFEEVIDDSAAHKMNSHKELTSKRETCWNAVWPPVEKPQEQEPRKSRARKEASAQEVRGYYKQLAERNTSSGNPELTKRFLISLI